jgi:hypothetical protein
VGPPVFRPGTSSIQPAHLLIVGTVAAASAGALIVHGTRPANIAFVVLAIVSTGVAASAVYRTLWPLASDVGPIQPEMMGGRTRAALEREKTIVLRAIKELEFDRAMGKVSEADCEEMIGRLRARAVRLIGQLDAGSAGYRELIERELNARLGAGSPTEESAGSSCAVCGAVNDADAKFCKACGTKLGVPA